MPEQFEMSVTTRGLISLLQSNLTDRYKDYFCIIQELLQNADDAEAETVVYGVSKKGLPGKHPLAELPGMFVINDGPVSRKNMQAIFSVAAGDKGNEKNKIGKFGLGMKSVFHACEAFFMFGEGHQEGLLPQICTPWLGHFHKDWREAWPAASDEMGHEVSQLVKSVIPEARRWFCVWMPLRSSAAESGIAPIIGEYPGDENIDDLICAEYVRSAARFLPMLKHVKRLLFISADGKRVESRINAGTRLCGAADSILEGGLVAKTKDDIFYEYIGEEKIDVDASYGELRKSSLWPMRTDFVEEDDGRVIRFKTYPDKTSPHVAVCILKEPSDSPKVTVSPCVYLPLSGVRDDPVRFSVPCVGSDDSFSLYLHGNFFVDAGRQEFDVGEPRHSSLESPKDSTTLQKSWNRRLFSKSILPLVIPQLESASKKWPGKSFNAFMKALPEVPYLKPWLGEIGIKERFLKTLSVVGWRWARIPCGHSIYSLPAPKDAELSRRICEMLPSNIHLVDLSCGGITGQGLMQANDEAFVKAVLCAAEEVADEDLVTDLTREFWFEFFTRFPGRTMYRAFWRRVIGNKMLKRYEDFITENKQLILKCRDCFTVLKDCRVSIKDTSLWQRIALAAKDRIPLPNVNSELFGLDPNVISLSDARAMLDVIRTVPESERGSGIACDTALAIARCVGVGNLPDAYKNFAYWVIDKQFYSYSQLEELSAAGHLYRGTIESFEKTTFLSAVEWTFLRVSSEDRRDGLMDALSLEAPCLNADLFIKILNQAPNLKDVDSRCTLVGYLLRNESSDGHAWQLAIRYLIHGNKALCSNLQKLYFPAKNLPAGFARSALSAIARAESKESYEIPEQIVSVISGPIREQLRIHEVDNEFLVRLLATTENLSFAQFDDDAWKDLLRLADSVYYNEETQDLLKRIPLFRTDDGRRVALEGDSFRQGRPEVPEVFRNVVKVIPDAGDKELDKRLALVVRKWSYEDSLDFARKLELDPGQLADIVRPILRLLPSISERNREFVSSKAWVKSARGYVAPGKLLDLPGLSHICEASDLVYPDDVGDDRLLEDLSKHRLLPSRVESLKRVFSHLADEDRYLIGSVPVLGSFCANDFLDVFDNLQVMPIVGVLKECRDLGFSCDEALPALRRSFGLERYVQIVNYLTGKENTDAKWLYAYLEEMAPFLSQSRETIKQLSVLCCDLSVKSASSVCTYAEGVSAEYVLHGDYSARAPDFFACLSDNRATIRPASDSRIGSFASYFKDWDQVFNERIAGFVFCCTDEEDVLRQAAIKWGLDGRGNPESWREKICGELHRMMKNQRLKLWIYDTSEIEVVALDGSVIRLGLEKIGLGDTLFYGEGNPCRYDPMPRIRSLYSGLSARRLELKLRRLKPDELKQSVVVLDSVLRKTLELIVHRLCGQWVIDVDGFWKELSNVEQVDIAVTRDKLLEKADVYLPMLRCKDEALKRHIKSWDELGYAIHDVRNRPGCDRRYQELLKQKESQLRAFSATIEATPQVQANILAAIREQMESYAYHRDSLLFELFQNADDAAEELRALYPGRQNGFKDSFIVTYEDGKLIVAHWGRQINQNKGVGVEASTHPSFARDLEKMLMLMQSGKGSEGIDVTGKFGLGFKTVFFFSDEPIVMSGRLRFKIIGGFLPKALDDAELVRVEPIWSRFSKGCGVLKPTVFILPIKSGCEEYVESAMSAFAAQAELSAAFARRIRKISLSYGDGRKVEVDGSSVLAGGKYRFFDTCPANSVGAVVVGLQDGFPQPMPSEIPTYWVTVPTRQHLKAGFVINGRFALDTGRSNLNRAAQYNRAAVVEMGKGLYASLVRDYESRKGDGNNVGYYEGLWSVLSCCHDLKIWEHDSAYLAQGILWDDGCGGARKLFSEKPVLPTGLSGAYRALTDVATIRYVLERELVESPLSDILGLAGLVPRTVVSGVLYPKAAHAYVNGLKAEPFGVQEYFGEAAKYIGKLSPDIANSGPGEKLLEFLGGDGHSRELAKSFCEKVQFLAADGNTWRQACDLVADEGDESLKAAFCPKSAILSDQYNDVGIKLFRKLRGQKILSAEQLARYAAAADTEGLRISVLQYLLKKKDEGMAGFLSGNLNSPWLDEIQNIPWFQKLQQHDKMSLAALLHLGLGVLFGAVDGGGGESDPEIEFRELTPEMVRQWWNMNRHSCLVAYNRRLYDREDVCDITFNITDNPIMRSEWLELFVLASACTLGFRDCQHKGFVRMLKTRGYWKVYASADSTADEWMDTLEDFICLPAFAQEYQCWMRLFIRIYQFGRYLDGYVKYVETWNEATEKDVWNLLSIRGNPALTGTGIALPDLERAINKSGLHFLVRELIRRKALSNPALYVYGGLPAAFKGETFDGAFDLALKSYVNENSESGVRYVF